MTIRKRTILSLIALSITAISWAVPAKRIKTTHLQSDGTTITVQLTGDERSHCYRTLDGMALTQASDGNFYYASSNVLAHNMSQRSAAEASFIAENASLLTGDRNTPRRTKAKAALKDDEPQVPHMGSPRIPIVLVGYNNLKLKGNPEENFEKHFNTNEKSAYNYFADQSFGKFTPQFDILGVANLTQDRKVYGGNDYYGNDLGVGLMVGEACEMFKDVDWTQYDNDGDGYVDVVIVLYAGTGEAQGGPSESVWPCQWDLYSSDYGKNLDMGEVIISKFAVFNELYGSSDKSSTIDGVGTFCHEFSHCLGLPDFYCTNSMSYYGMGSWSLMDYGCYNDNAYTPVGYTAYERDFFGWMQIEDAEPNSIITLSPVPAGGKAYRIANDQDPTGNEYFIIENRKKAGWEEYMASDGLMVTHVDYDAKVWNANTVNNNGQRQRMTIVAADNKCSLYNEAGDLYPYNGNNELTDSSTPAARVYTGEGSVKRLHKPITGITKNNDGTITLRFMYEGIPGDVDDNGTVDIKDANIIINIILGKDSPDNYDGRADVDGNGSVDIKDANIIINSILGK